jgi:ligand-binding sensor domain-containing protein
MLRSGTGWINGFLEYSGKIWIASSGNSPLYTYANGKLDAFRRLTVNTEAWGLAKSADESFWLGTLNGLYLIDPKKTFLHSVDRDQITGEVNSIVPDRAGNLWLGMTDRGLVRITQGQVSSFGSQDGLSDSKVNTIYEDQEGSLWVVRPAVAPGLLGFLSFCRDSAQVPSHRH